MDKIFWKSSKQPLSPLPLGIVDIGVLPRCTFSTHYSPNGNDFLVVVVVVGVVVGVEVVEVVVGGVGGGGVVGGVGGGGGQAYLKS